MKNLIGLVLLFALLSSTIADAANPAPTPQGPNRRQRLAMTACGVFGSMARPFRAAANSVRAYMHAQQNDPAPLLTDLYSDAWLSGFRKLTKDGMRDKWDEIKNTSVASQMGPLLAADQGITDEVAPAAFDQFDSMVRKSIAVYERNVDRGFNRKQLLAYWESQKEIYKKKSVMNHLVSSGRSYADFVEGFPIRMSSARAGSRLATVAHSLRRPGPVITAAGTVAVLKIGEKAVDLGVDLVKDIWFKDPAKDKILSLVDAEKKEEEKRIARMKQDLLLIADNLSRLPAQIKSQEVNNFRIQLSKMRPGLKAFIAELRAKSHSKGATAASLTLNDPPALPANFDSKLDSLYAEFKALTTDGDSLRDKRIRTDNETELDKINGQIASNETEIRGLQYKIAGMLGVRMAYELYLDDKAPIAANDSRNDRFWEIAAQTNIRLRMPGNNGETNQDYISAAVDDIRNVFEGEKASKFGALYSYAAKVVLEDAEASNEAIANSKTAAP